MQKNRFKIFTLVFLFSFCGYSQEEAKQVLEKFKKHYFSLENYQANVAYKIYKGHESKVPYEISKGVYFKKGDNLYSKINEVEIINTINHYLKVNHQEKAVLLANGSKKPKNVNEFNIEELLKYLDIDSFKQTDLSWEIVLKSKPITQLPFSSLKIVIDKKTLNLKKQVFFYFRKMDFSKQLKKTDNAQVKLEVNYSNYKLNSFSVSDYVFNIKRYLKKTKDTYIGVNICKKYQIINIKK
jgi:outer membrane lipoprotein-sorting protein